MRYRVMLTDSENIFDVDIGRDSVITFENLSREETETLEKIAVNQPQVMMVVIPICEE